MLYKEPIGRFLRQLHLLQKVTAVRQALLTWEVTYIEQNGRGYYNASGYDSVLKKILLATALEALCKY